jgi:hypothetical protein
MAATTPDRRPEPPRCGPYGEPVWDAAARRWHRRLTDAGRDLAAAYLAEHPRMVKLVCHAYPQLYRACRPTAARTHHVT